MHKKTFLICPLALLPVVAATPLILTSCGGKYTSKHFSYDNVSYINEPLSTNEEFNKLISTDKINYLNKNINETIYCDDFLYTFVSWFDDSVTLKSDHSKIRDYIGNIATSYNKGYGGIDLRFEFKEKKDISILFPGSEIVKEYTKVDYINLLTESEFNINNIDNKSNQNIYSLQTRNASKYFMFKVYYEDSNSKRVSDEYDLSSLDIQTRVYKNYEF